MRIETDWIGMSKVLQRIQRLITNGDWTPAPEQAGKYMRESIERTFAAAPWRESRRSRLVGGPTLSDTGTLLAAILTGRSRGGASSFYQTMGPDDSRPSVYEQVRPGASHHSARGVFKVTRSSVTLGVASRYAAPTQFGFMNKPVAIIFKRPLAVPPRPFLKFSLEDIKHIVANWFKWAARSFSLSETGGM